MSCVRKSLITHTATKLLACGLFFGASLSHAAEEITLISTVSADSGWELPLERKRPYGAITANRGDQIVLQTSGLKRYAFLITDARKSSLGNSIIRGRGNGGGRSLFVIDPNGHVKGHFVDSDGMVQVTTDEYGVITAWREGIDTVPVPFKCGAEKAPEPDWLRLEKSATPERERRTLLKAQKLVVEEEEPDFRYARYGSGHATVRVLIYYDSSMAEYIKRLADFLIELTNDAFTNSLIPISLELAGIKSIEVDDMTPNSTLVQAMYFKSAPFESIEYDRETFPADLTATLRDAEDGQPEDESGGIAYTGNQFSVQTDSVTRYKRYSPGEPFYPSYMFSHEIGHNLSAKHARWQYTDEEMQAFTGFSYAYGYRIEGSRRTIMSYAGGGTRENGTFSNPEVLFEDQPMGVAFTEESSADSSRAFWNNRHVASSLTNGGDIASEQVRETLSVVESNCGEELEEDDEKGEARRHRLYVSATSGIRINSSHKIRPDGSARVYRYSPGSTFASHFDCRLPDEGLSSLGTEYVESFFRYIDPESGELVEGAHVFWEEDMDGDYSLIRVAHTDGGEAVGNTSLILKEGSEHTVEFNADYGFKLTDIESSCDGRRAGNSYIVSVTSDDCRVEATFTEGTISSKAADRFNGMLSIIQGLGKPKPPPADTNQFVGTYHIFRNQRPGREDFIRIGADQSLAFGSNTTFYRWEMKGGNLDAYYMNQPDDPSGDYRFTLSLDNESGRIEVVDSYSSSTFWDFYGERKSTDSEFEFDLYELGRDWYGDEQHILKCFNIGRHENSFYSTSWYSDSQLPATSTDLEECRSYCPAILEDYQERDPDAWADRVCEGDESRLDEG